MVSKAVGSQGHMFFRRLCPTAAVGVTAPLTAPARYMSSLRETQAAMERVYYGEAPLESVQGMQTCGQRSAAGAVEIVDGNAAIFDAAERDLAAFCTASPTVPMDHVLDAVPDLVPYLLSALPGDALRKVADGGPTRPSGSAPYREVCSWSSETEMVEFFLHRFLPQYIVSYEGSGTGSVSLTDLCVGVDAFRRYLRPVMLDAGRWSMLHHPGLWVPEGQNEEHLCLPLLHWFTDRRKECSGSTDALRVLDIGCGSGYVADLLLKSGVQSLVCTDHAANALEATERTIQAHWSMRRSSHVGRTVDVMLSATVPPFVTASPRLQTATPTDGPAGKVGSVSLAAAARRRKLGRAHRSGVALSMDADGAKRNGDTFGGSDLHRAFDAACVHLSPHIPTVNPLACLRALRVAQHDAPYANRSGLTALLSKLLDVTGPLDPSRDASIVLQLPRRTLHRSHLAGEMPRGNPSSQSLADFVATFVAAEGGGGRWSIVHRRTVPMFPSSGGAAQQMLHSFVQNRQCQRLLRGRGPKDPLGQHRCVSDVAQWVHESTGVEFMVLERPPIAPGAAQRCSVAPATQPVWEETFEYQQYLPKNGPPNPHHWTELIPSFQHLEQGDLPFVDGTTAAGAVLATDQREAKMRKALMLRNDPSATIAQSKRVMAVNQAAEANLSAVFGHELRTQRRTRARKLAFAAKANVEWYLDEKVAKSQAAKVEVLNEVLKKMDVSEPN